MKYISKTLKILLILSLLASLTSCANGISGLLGIDNTDYGAEEVISSLDKKGEIAQQLSSVCSVLTFGTGEIICFDSFKAVAEEYSDTVLDYLAGTHFEKYSADDKMFSALAENYPELSVNTLIPAYDYENTVYRFFGGDIHLKNKNTSRFSYLDKINAYILTGKLTSVYTSVEIVNLEETANTYRAVVRFSQNGIAYTDDYFIIFRKRAENEIPYIYSVSVNESIVVETEKI